MGNTGSAGVANRRNSNQHHYHHQSASAPPPPQPPPPDSAGNGYVFAGATPYAPQYPSPHQPPYYHYPGYYSQPPPVMPLPIPAPFDQRLQSWPGHGRYPAAPVPFVPSPLVEHQTAVVIKNLVNINKKTLRVEPDELNPGQFLVAFTFDANAAGKISIHFFAEVGFDDSSVTPTKEKLFKPATVFFFNKGLGQKFRQPSGSGIALSMFKEAELVNQGEKEVYPLVIKGDASPPDAQSGNQNPTGTPNSQITESIFEKKDNGEFQVRVVKQVLWDNGKRYELEEIYGIGNSVEGDSNENDPGKECVICLSEPRDTTVLPCRHMCMCSACAKVLRFQTNRCPICRQPVESLLEIKVKHNRDHDEQILLPSGQD